MDLYLVQHAEAKPKELDPERPLSERGLADVQKMAALTVGRCRITAEHIFHSGKARARQTAEGLLEGLKLPGACQPADGLEPLADPEPWVIRLAETASDTMLVGHLPHLGKLAAALLCGDQEKKIIDFQMGAIVALRRHEAGIWSVQWMLTPQMLECGWDGGR